MTAETIVDPQGNLLTIYFNGLVEDTDEEEAWDDDYETESRGYDIEYGSEDLTPEKLFELQKAVMEYYVSEVINTENDPAVFCNNESEIDDYGLPPAQTEREKEQCRGRKAAWHANALDPKNWIHIDKTLHSMEFEMENGLVVLEGTVSRALTLKGSSGNVVGEVLLYPNGKICVAGIYNGY